MATKGDGVEGDGGGDDRESKVRPIRPSPENPPNDPPKEEPSSSGLDELKALLDEAKPKPKERDFSLEDLSDDNVIEDSEAFHYRFGRGFNWKRHFRESFMKLKTQKRIADREAKVLRLFGNLTPQNVEVELTSNPIQVGIGLLTLGYVALALLGLIAWAFSIGHPTVLQFIKLANGIGLLMAFGYTVYLSHVLPWVVKRR
ncbi:hypothetical protein [Hydrocarboniphaga effusa]|jgi:hypothetical protein|uniref:hypothetical protein n=1 Tax=Hydrocarboniphaga effusa TaxID=243629 RepID=UPI003BA970A2